MRRILAGLLLLLLALPAWAERAVVASPRGANLYNGPGKKAQKLDILAKNTELETFEEREGRVRVKFPGGEGWVAKVVLREAPNKPAAPEKKQEPEKKPEPVAKPAAPAAPAAAAPAPAPAVAPAPSTTSTSSTQSTPPPSTPPSDAGYLAQALKEEPVAKVETGPGLVTVLGSLFVVLALVAGAVYGVKVLAGRRLVGGAARSKGIQVLSSRPLGPRQALLLVEVGGLPLLLAQSEGMVNLISEIRDPEAVKRLNDLYGFRDTPFEAELRSRFDLESEDEDAGLSAEERLAALRRRRRSGEES